MVDLPWSLSLDPDLLIMVTPDLELGSRVIKYVVQMMMNNDNVESSLLTSILLYVTWYMYKFCYKLHICRAVLLLVELCPL